MEFVKVPVERPDMMIEFMRKSMFTVEGISDELIDKHSKKRKVFAKHFEEIARIFGFDEKYMTGYYFNGKMMNECFGYSGDNAYPDNFNFLVVDDLHIPSMKQYFKDNGVEVRWFDDIVSSNAIKQHAFDDGLEPDFQ